MQATRWCGSVCGAPLVGTVACFAAGQIVTNVEKTTNSAPLSRIWGRPSFNLSRSSWGPLIYDAEDRVPHSTLPTAGPPTTHNHF